MAYKPFAVCLCAILTNLTSVLFKRVFTQGNTEYTLFSFPLIYLCEYGKFLLQQTLSHSPQYIIIVFQHINVVVTSIVMNALLVQNTNNVHVL